MFLFNMSNKSTSLFLSLKKKVSRYLEKKKKKTVQESTMKNYPEIKKIGNRSGRLLKDIYWNEVGNTVEPAREGRYITSDTW